jgi:DNA-damage-inducible protein J
MHITLYIKEDVLMGQQINVNIRMDSDIKKQADLLFNDFGLNFTTAVNAFIRQALRERAIPFQIRTVEPEHNRAAVLARGKNIMRELQAESFKKGLDKMTLDNINTVIAEVSVKHKEG